VASYCRLLYAVRYLAWLFGGLGSASPTALILLGITLPLPAAIPYTLVFFNLLHFVSVVVDRVKLCISWSFSG
jgi:hypothetical protein